MKKTLSLIAKKYHIDLIILFGSLAKNRTHKKSDIDIAIRTQKALTLSKELELRSDLFRIFKKEIDLADLHKASPLLLGQIARHGKLLYGNKKIFLSFKIYAMKCYFDFEPYFRLREQTIERCLSHSYAR